MSIYVDGAVAAIEDLRAYCERFLVRFDDGTPSKDLLSQLDDLVARLKELKALLPDGVSLGDWGRKIHFMDLFLRKDERQSCRSDLVDLIRYDLPAASQQVREWARKLENFDEELRQKVGHALRGRDFASAVRAAFVVLTERIRETFNLPPGKDGQELVNDAFGKGAGLTPNLSKDERQGIRDYLAGAYALLRNKYAHSNPPIDLAELEAALATVNFALKLVERSA